MNPILLILFLLAGKPETEPPNIGFLTPSEMQQFQQYNPTEHLKQEWRRNGKWDMNVNIMQYEFESIILYYNSDHPEKLDSCSYSLWSVYEKWEEYADGGSSFQSNQLRLEHAVFNPNTKKLYYEQSIELQTQLDLWVIQATDPPSIRMDTLRAMCKKEKAKEGYNLTRKEKVGPHWEPHN